MDGFKKLEGWRVCRIDPVFRIDPGQREYGHWWIEVGPRESYGFWPSRPVSGLLETIMGVPGAVNPGNPMRDPYHGDRGRGINEFDVWALAEVDEAELLDEIRAFARDFDSNWAWPALAGENCHSFQQKLLHKCGLRITPRR